MIDEANELSDLDQLQSRYEILRHLGVDGQTSVYAARTRGTDRHFAVKILADRASRGTAPGALHSWQAHNVEPLEHPMLMPLHAVHHLQGGAVAVAMERRRGKSLAERMREGPLSIADAESVLRDIGEALAYLHSRGVAHRGVRPETIFLDRDARHARLAHFAIDGGRSRKADASVDSRPSVADRTRGTPSTAGVASAGHVDRPEASPVAYLAPEQLKGEEPFESHRVGPAADLFSLGLVGWEMLTGVHPGEASGFGASWRKRLVGTLAEHCPDAPANLTATIDRCLEHRVSRRVASGSDFLALLDETPEVRETPDAGRRRTGRPRMRIAPKATVGAVMKALHMPGSATESPTLSPSTAAPPPKIRARALSSLVPTRRALAVPAALIAGIALASLQSYVRTGDSSTASDGSGALDEIGQAEAGNALVRPDSTGPRVDFLDGSGTASYRISIEEAKEERAAERTATAPVTQSRSSEADRPQASPTRIRVPLNPLREEVGAPTAGLVLLGDPIRR